MDAIKEMLEAGRPEDALRRLLAEARATSDYGRYAKLCRLRARMADVRPADLRPLRIALMGGATTDFLAAPLRLELESVGLDATLFSGEYGTYAQQMLDADSDAVAFAPEVAVLLLTHASIATWPAVGDGAADVNALVDRVAGEWLALCERFHERTGCEIIVTNLHATAARVMGNLGSRLPWDPNTFLRQLNRALGERAPAYVHVLDIETLAALHGVATWFDPRFWHHSKQPVSFACLVPFVRNLAAMIGAIYGRTAKCLVLDLDNTLWGGVVGDDGVEGLRIGEGDAESEAFKAFQTYLLRLKERGLLLAVCSKNEEANALAPFEQLPEMVLRRRDFVAFKASWGPKSDAVQAIARELNLGLDALVFVDDNPAERELIKQALPQVKVVELSRDPAEYPALLDQSGWLEVTRLTDEDRRKTEQYLENQQRDALLTAHADYDGYLASLGQQATIRPFDRESLDRVTQLINKTNQFNLTTMRMTRSEVEALLDRPDVYTACVRLVDRFGDNGIISALSGHVRDGVLHVDLWLMSCRVFKRGRRAPRGQPVVCVGGPRRRARGAGPLRADRQERHRGRSLPEPRVCGLRDGSRTAVPSGCCALAITSRIPCTSH